MKIFLGATALAATLASAGNQQCRDKAKKTTLLNTKRRTKPGTGMDVSKMKETVLKEAFRDGYFHVACMNEGMRFDADKHSMQGSKRYAAQNVEVSVVWYNNEELIPKEDREEMTPNVCFNFCRSLRDMNFFGLLNGRDCYCMPYYKAKAGGEDQQCDMPCDGDNTQFCGGKDKTDIYEMHFCQDTAEDLSDVIGKMRTMLSDLYEPMVNLGVSAAALQYIGSMTQIYGGQGGDLIAGNQAQHMKVKAGEYFKLLRRVMKGYKTLDTKMRKMSEQLDNDFSEHKQITKAEDRIREAKKILIGLEDELEAVRTARNAAAGYRGGGHQDAIDQYNAVVEYAKEYDVKGAANTTDSMCQGKELLGTFQGKMSDCAFRCDRMLHPKKCFAFQHYNIVKYEKNTGDEAPEYVLCKWWDDKKSWGSYKTAEDGLNAGVCSYIENEERKSDAKSEYENLPGKEQFELAYGDFVAEGPFTMQVKPTGSMEDKGCFVTWWSDRQRSYVLNKPCNQPGGDYTLWTSGNMKTVTAAELEKMEFKFEEGRHMVLSNFYHGFGAGRPVNFTIKRKTVPEMGICTLYGDITNISYYTCPDGDKDDDLNGSNSKCYLKVSESKGFDVKKEVRNQRCLITGKIEVPLYKEWDFDAEIAKIKID